MTKALKSLREEREEIRLLVTRLVRSQVPEKESFAAPPLDLWPRHACDNLGPGMTAALEELLQRGVK